ncbi:MAG: hypothetical protein FWH52_06070, partial [Synergistaceae bacterium]|nr:hypothetical protein [Synergistaceae bacterium]
KNQKRRRGFRSPRTPKRPGASPWTPKTVGIRRELQSAGRTSIPFSAFRRKNIHTVLCLPQEEMIISMIDMFNVGSKHD